jgi:hypothetical protein
MSLGVVRAGSSRRCRAWAELAPPKRQPHAGPSIVVAENDSRLREGIASLLLDAGHAVVGRASDAAHLLPIVHS